MNTNKLAELPVLRITEMLTVRNLGGRQAFLYQDLAKGFEVEPARVRQAYQRNAPLWDTEETGVYQFDTPSGVQEVRWFTARGAMRFCRYVKSGRSDQLFNHLLDLWEAERAAPVAATSEVDKLAATLNGYLPQLAGQVRQVEVRQEVIAERVTAVEERVKATDPRAIERRMAYLEKIKGQLVAATKGQPQPVAHPAYWRELKAIIGINSFTNRAALTVEDMDKCVAYARLWCQTRGVTPLPIPFGEAEQDKAG
jgi:hypothetical protein